MSRLFESINKYWHYSATDLCAVGTAGERSEQWSKTFQLLLSANESVSSPTAWEFKSLAQSAAELACSDEIELPRPNDRKIDVALQMADRIGWHLRAFLTFAPEGLRFFVKDKDGFREGTDSDPDWHYVHLMVERGGFEGIRDVAVPSWAENLYIGFENERRWKAIWCDLPDTNREGYTFAWHARRRALNWLCADGGESNLLQLGGQSYPAELRAATEAFKDGLHATKLRPLIDIWPLVRDRLEIDGFQAIDVIEHIIQDERLTLYCPDENSGLYFAIRGELEALDRMGELGVSDYAQAVANRHDPLPGAVPPDDLRVTHADFEKLMAAVDAIVGPKAIEQHASSDYPPELRAAIEAFEAVSRDPAATAKQTPKAALAAWLAEYKPELSGNARDRIATVANWQPQGGAPKTPG